MAAPIPTDASAISVIITLVILEAALSFDNAAILAAITRKLPAQDRAKALNIGLTLAYILRVAAIALVFVLLKYSFLIAIGGAYLIFLFFKHFIQLARGTVHGDGEEGNAEIGFLRKLGMAPFTAAIVTIGTVDLAFAIDQVVAAFGFTKEIWLIVVAATVGLLSLRLLAPYLTRLMDWLPLLEHMAYVAVGFVGGILVYDWLGTSGYIEEHHLPTSIKVGVTLSLFGLPVLWRLTLGRNVEMHHPPHGGH